jgi:hypothetical protein
MGIVRGGDIHWGVMGRRGDTKTMRLGGWESQGRNSRHTQGVEPALPNDDTTPEGACSLETTEGPSVYTALAGKALLMGRSTQDAQTERKRPES